MSLKQPDYVVGASGDCQWPGNDPLYRQYHDQHWGRPTFSDRELFAKLCLDGQQAGLSWLTILRKQAAYYEAFAHFDPHTLAQWSEDDVQRLMANPGIVRNRQKIRSVIKNAQGFLLITEQEQLSFSRFLWQFVDFQQQVNSVSAAAPAPTTSPASKAMAKALKKRGFSFVGETICYAFMEAVGMINNHLDTCHCKETCCLPVAAYPWSVNGKS